jgi:hypothetical protein
MNNDINSTRVLQLFKNLGYDLIETKVGVAIVFNPVNAFVFSLVTGASYLDDNHFPFTLKGLTKLFNSAFSTKPVWGLLDGDELGFTPRNICNIRPYVFDGPKFVIPVDITTEADSRDWVGQARGILHDPENFLLFRVETWKSGNGMEPLLEYLACHTFRHLGLLVESQIPLTATTGSPDFLALRDDSLFDSLNLRFKNSFSGAHLIELAQLFSPKLDHSQWPIETVDPLSLDILSVVGEAKVGNASPLTQLSKYDSTGFFSQQLALLDRSPATRKAPLSYLYVSSRDSVVLETNAQSPTTSRDSKIHQYRNWYHLVAKCYLLANFDSTSILALKRTRALPKLSTTAQTLIELADQLDVEEILDILPANV